MKTKPVLTLVILGAIASITLPAQAQQDALFPQESCAQALEENSRDAALWAFGYLSRMDAITPPVEEDALNALAAGLAAACKASPQTTFVTLVEQQSEGGAPSAEAGSPPDNAPEVAASLLEKFAGTSPDMVEIILSVKPTPEEVRTMFPEPMASRLIETYDDMFGPRLVNEEFPPGSIEITSGFTTTFELAQAPFLDELPGGFQRVLDQYRLDVPFAYVKVLFVEVQDDMNLSGFVYLNDRWVLMLRPWRGLE